MKLRRFLAMMLTLTLLLTTINISGFAAVDEAFQGMINLREDSNWQGSVFGDVGGQDKIVKENFEITENQDDTVMIKTANNKGKLAGESEGIAYYFREAPTDANFTISATVHVDTWTANNQVSFGIMLRDEVLINEHTGNVNFGSYVAVGAVGQEMRAFYKDNTTGSGIKVDYDPFANVVQPTVGRTYDLSIQKMGDLLILSVDGETEIINTTTYQGENNYVGLFASRNTTVTFSNIELNIEGQIELGDWKDSFFGDNGGDAVILDPNNYGFTQNPDGSMTIKVANNRGKIAGETEGIAYYFKEIPADVNFEIKTRAKVDAWTGNNQVAFGLMLRSNVLDYQNLGSFTGDYVAVGALDQVMKGFYKYAGSGIQKADHLFSDAINPAAGQEYDLSLQKSGDLYVLKVGDETQILQDYTGEINYAGLFVSRNATVTFSDFEIIVDNRKIEELNVDYSGMKTDYLVGESLDLSGLLITALYDDGSEALIDPSDVIVTGFNSSEVGSNRITINYSGVTVTIDLQIVPLTVSELSIKYLPAKTDYYKLDVFNPLGMVVLANYNNGYTIEEISSDDYTILINNQPSTLENPYVFTTEGEMTVVIEAANGVTTDFKVNVKAANLESLEIRQNPEVMQYFIGDELDLDGIVVYAKYDDGSEVRLTRDEFEVTGFDSTIASDIELTITHKGIEIKLTVNVKVKDSQGIEVTNYPKTTYFIGDSFDNSGLVVSEVFDNGDRTPVSGYQMDTSHFDSSQPGVYEILITYGDDTTTLRVTVREKVEYQWNKVIFGQSISSSRNFINERNDHIEIIALEGGGKVTGDHDGISFYYIELDAEEDNFTLSADIKVVDYAKPNHDGQESFGIMARDAIDGHLKSDVFSSNIAAIGGYSGGTRNPNGTQLFARTGVLGSDGEGGKGIKAVMLQEGRPTASITYPVQNYRLTLSKTNSGFTGKINDGAEAIIFEPEILKVQDGKMYVGFYSARLATIEVYNIELDVTAAATDAQKVEPPKEPVVPGVRFESLGRYSLENYNVMIDANVDGTVSVRQGNTTIVSNVAVNGGEILSIPTTITKNNTTNFSLTFIPDDTQLLTSYDVIVRNFTVDMRTYQEGGDIYVSPIGTPSGNGSRQNPLDLDTAIDFVMPGQRIVVLDGHYVRNKPLEIKKYNDGTADARKYLVAEEGTRPVIDFDQRSEGVVHSGHYWHVKGLDFARSAGNTKGYTVGGSYNIIELVTLYEHGDTGLQISRTDTTENDPAKWPSYNLILNSTSFNNSDPSQNNADGFAAKLTSGEGNVFDGCIAYNNIDDGWDLYAKVGTGAIGAVTIRNSIAYNNGFLKGQAPGAGDGNGFKLGGEGIHVPHVIENSVAFGNVADGFSSNSNPAVIVRGENIALNNATNLNLYTYSNITPDFQLDGFVSFHYNNPRAVRDRLPASQEAQLRSDSNFLFNGSKSVNASGSELTTSHFSNLVMPEEINRLADGSIDWSFLVYDPTGSQTPILPEEPSNPTDPIEMPEGAIFFENFEGATASNLWTATYKALPDDESKPMYIRKSGESSVSIENDSITLRGGRFTIGAASSTDSSANSKPEGVLDLSKPYQIIFDIANLEGTDNFIVYVDNNTTTMANSPLGGSSRVYQEVVNEIEAGLLVIEPAVGTEASFIQVRTSGSGIVTINAITIKYIEEEGEVIDPVDPVDPVNPVSPVNPVNPDPSDSNDDYYDNGEDHTEQDKADETTEDEKKDTEEDQQENKDSEESQDSPPSILISPTGVKITTEKVTYISGYTDGTVRPDAKMTREEVLTLIFKLVIKEDEGTKNTNTIFTDVDPNSWSAEAILYFLDHGLVNGYQDGSFRPKDQITRAEFITILANFIPVDAPAVSSRVLQDTNDSWAKESIERAVAAGWIQGYPDGTFRPNEAISRAEVIVIMNRVLGRVPSQSELQDAGFSDLPETHWAYEDILEATR